MLQRKKRCGSDETMSRNRGERIFLLSDKVEKNMMSDAEMAAELQGLQAGGERRGRNASQSGDCCLEALWQQIAAVCAAVRPNHAVFQRFKVSGAVQEQVPGRGETRRNGEDEQEQGRVSQQLASPTPGVVNQDAQREVWSFIFLVFKSFLVRPKCRKIRHTRGSQERSIQISRTSLHG